MHNRTLIFAALGLLLLSSQSYAADVNLGSKTYQRHCLMCHGNDGRGNMAGAPDFSRGEGLLQSDPALLDRIKRGKNACPAYIGILDEQEILDVIAYIRTLF